MRGASSCRSVRRRRRLSAALLTPLRVLCFGWLAFSWTGHGRAWAADTTPDEAFRQGAEALRRGEYGAAIDGFERLADQGFVHPDASFNRGVAYATRYRTGAGRPGDLGRAAAAFEEALLLRSNDVEADHALDLVRAEVTRTLARQAKRAVVARPTLDRAIVAVATESTWGLLAVAASCMLAVGLALGARSGRPHIVGSIVAPTAAVLLVIFASLTFAARWLRLATRPGVVIATEAVLHDDQGRALSVDPVPEAASVEVHDREGRDAGDPVGPDRRLGTCDGRPSSGQAVLSQAMALGSSPVYVCPLRKACSEPAHVDAAAPSTAPFVRAPSSSAAHAHARAGFAKTRTNNPPAKPGGFGE